MPLAEDIISSRYSFQGYDRDHVSINDRQYFSSLLLSANQLISSWPVSSVEHLQPQHLQPIFDLRPDVVLLGTGEQQTFPAVDIIGEFARQGLGLEVMDTGALCRTFNILVAEDRNVVAAVIQPAG